MSHPARLLLLPPFGPLSQARNYLLNRELKDISEVRVVRGSWGGQRAIGGRSPHAVHGAVTGGASGVWGIRKAIAAYGGQRCKAMGAQQQLGHRRDALEGVGAPPPPPPGGRAYAPSLSP